MLIRLLCLLLLAAAAALTPALALGARLADAGQIAFHSDVDGDSDVYLLDVRTRTLHNLTHTNPDYDSSPSWSPDGARLAFASRRPERGDQAQLIYMMNLDGSGIERVTQLRSRKPSWSPDGMQIAFTSVADTIIVAQLNQPSEIALGGGASADWSPDARQLVVDVPFPVSGIGIVDVDSSVRRMLTPGAAFFSEPDWSPQGDWIAFADSVGNEWDIFLLPVACLWDCEPQRIQLTGAGSRDIMPDWSPEGARIAYVCGVDICVMELATGAIDRLTRLPPYAGAGAPAWRP